MFTMSSSCSSCRGRGKRTIKSCPECKGAGKKRENKKINMTVEVEEQCYICPECKHITNWKENDTFEEQN